MALKIADRVVDGVAVEELEGRIVLGEESNALREKVKSLLAAGQKKVVLNMDNVTYIDSSGLGTLVASHTSARAQGASLKISNLGSKFQEILRVTAKLVTVFDLLPLGSRGSRQLHKVISFCRNSLASPAFDRRCPFFCVNHL